MGCANSTVDLPRTKSSTKNLDRNKSEHGNSSTANSSLRYSESVLPHSIQKDGISILAKCPSARQAFIQYLKLEYKSEDQSVHDMLDRLNFECNGPELAAKADSILASYQVNTPDIQMKIPSTMSTESTDSLHFLESPAKTRARRHSVTKSVYRNQCSALFILSAFPWFAQSQAYEDWCESEDALKITTISPTLGSSLDSSVETPHRRFSKSLQRGLSFTKFGSSRDDGFNIDRIMESAFSPENSPLLNAKSWLNTFIGIVEDLPFCVTLASANANKPGFPLVHVNTMFEDTTGYSKSEVIGKNCKFLQSGGFSEPAQIESISTALRTNQPLKIKITNYRKDGSKFKNLLALKPIFDIEGRYCFVVGIQIDCSADDSDADQITLVDNLFHIIPNVTFDMMKK